MGDEVMPDDGGLWTWCVIANVVDEHEVGVDHHIEHGTKIFSPGTKVYVSSYWRMDVRDNGGKVVVIGKARRQWRYVRMWVARDRLTNFRVGRVFDPRVLRRMAKDTGQNEPDPSDWSYMWWGNGDDGYRRASDQVALYNQDGYSA